MLETPKECFAVSRCGARDTFDNNLQKPRTSRISGKDLRAKNPPIFRGWGLPVAILTVIVLSPLASAQLVPRTGLGERFVQDIADNMRWLARGEKLELATLKFFIEFNETDEDVGVQCLLGGEPYKVLRAFDPKKRLMLQLNPRRSLRTQGVSDFFFESAEPSLDEVSMKEFLGRFPEGEYEFETITLDNQLQAGEVEFTHTIPAGPVITNPLDGDVVDPENLIITWEPVTMTTEFNPPQLPVKIVRYQVIVTCEDPLRVYSVDMPTDATSVSVPPEFLSQGTEYELEILAVEESDNQTISLLFFTTEK